MFVYKYQTFRYWNDRKNVSGYSCFVWNSSIEDISLYGFRLLLVDWHCRVMDDLFNVFVFGYLIRIVMSWINVCLGRQECIIKVRKVNLPECIVHHWCSPEYRVLAGILLWDSFVRCTPSGVCISSKLPHGHWPQRLSKDRHKTVEDWEDSSEK